MNDRRDNHSVQARWAEGTRSDRKQWVAQISPRLIWQPIFYPVLSLDYAIEIARDWNTKDVENGSVGYVTQFCVEADYVAQFPVKCVGSSKHRELWVPAEQLATFNAHIVGKIEVIQTFFGDKSG